MDNNQRKYFDIKRPGIVPASATSRPVVVGHRPMQADPMISRSRIDIKSKDKNPAVQGSDKKVVTVDRNSENGSLKADLDGIAPEQLNNSYNGDEEQRYLEDLEKAKNKAWLDKQPIKGEDPNTLEDVSDGQNSDKSITPTMPEFSEGQDLPLNNLPLTHEALPEDLSIQRNSFLAPSYKDQLIVDEEDLPGLGNDSPDRVDNAVKVVDRNDKAVNIHEHRDFSEEHRNKKVASKKPSKSLLQKIFKSRVSFIVVFVIIAMILVFINIVLLNKYLNS